MNPFNESKHRVLAFLIILLVAMALCPVTAQSQNAGKKLSEKDVIELLTGGVASTRVAEIAKQKGIAFPMDAAAERDIRAANGSDDLIQVLRGLAPRASSLPARTPHATPSPGSTTVLMIQSHPGECQVYVDDVPVGTTSLQGKLRLTRIGPGNHRVRLALAGYQDSEQAVTVTVGQTTTVAADLQAAAAPPPVYNPPPPAQPQVTTPSPPTLTNMPHTGFVSFSVAHDHGQSGQNYCVGIMSIGNGMIVYKSNNGIHNFEIPLNTVREAKRNAVYLAAMGVFHIKLAKGTNYNFAALNQQGQPQAPDAILTAIDQAMGK